MPTEINPWVLWALVILSGAGVLLLQYLIIKQCLDVRRNRAILLRRLQDIRKEGNR